MTDSWEALFDRADEYGVVCEDIQRELAAHRDG